mgnify:CR=1 FL=1
MGSGGGGLCLDSLATLCSHSDETFAASQGEDSSALLSEAIAEAQQSVVDADKKIQSIREGAPIASLVPSMVQPAETAEEEGEGYANSPAGLNMDFTQQQEQEQDQDAVPRM